MFASGYILSLQGVALGGDAHYSVQEQLQASSGINTAGVQGQPPYTKKAFNVFIRQFSSRISTEYMKVGICLGLESHELKNIDGKTNIEDKAYEMLMKWREINGTEATPQVLAKALCQSGRCDLAEEALSQSPYDFNDVLNKLSSKIVKIWKTVGTYLAIEDYMLDNIEHDVIKASEEKAYEMLMKWRETKASKATLELLAEALEKSDRSDLADVVKEFEKTGDIKFPK